MQPHVFPKGIFLKVPVIDLESRGAAAEMGAACRESGFFYLVNHGVSPALESRLDIESREFFALPTDEKMRIEMRRGGRAWRGYFPVGGELTSGKPDEKEGLYFGRELPAGNPLPLHGPNLFPARPAGLSKTVLEWIDVMTALSHRVMAKMAESLNLDSGYFADHYTRDPFVLFRIFHYPPTKGGWGVGEHTDYGFLTLLKQDDRGGLEVKSPRGWISAPPIPGSFVCNLGDMLDRLTKGLYRSTPHRVRNVSGKSRLSFPFFFDPAWTARVEPLPLPETAAVHRWDGTDLQNLEGRYGDYLLKKVGKVFPDLAAGVMARD